MCLCVSVCLISSEQYTIFTSFKHFQSWLPFTKCLRFPPIFTVKGSTNEPCLYFFVKDFDLDVYGLELCLVSCVALSKDL